MDGVDLKEFTEMDKIDIDRFISGKLKRFMELESEHESGGYSEETESPKSVWKRDLQQQTIRIVHHQVLKIREEDSHLGEDIGEGFSTKEKLDFLHLKSHVGTLFFSRPILPSSPLRGESCH